MGNAYDKLISNLHILEAIEVLEYEDSNHLAGDNKKRSEIKQKMLRDCIILATVYMEQEK